MVALIQRVSRALCQVRGKIIAKIEEGYLVFLGVARDDEESDVEWLSSKILNLRLFDDNQGKVNLSILETGGDILLVSQFTLLASSKKGNRPSFSMAAEPDKGEFFFKKMVQALEKKSGLRVFTGEFGEHMKIDLINDGPFTLILNSRNRI